jgi:hypothetical protein
MQVLQKAFNKALPDTLSKFVADLIIEKMAHQGVRLTKGQRAKILARVRAQDFGNLTFSGPGTVDRDLSIEFTDADLARVERSLRWSQNCRISCTT